MRLGLLLLAAFAPALVACGTAGNETGGADVKAAAAMPPVDYASLPEREVVVPVLDCEALKGEDFLAAVPDAPFRVTEAKLETRDNGVEFCRIKGIIAPQIQFEFHLPTKTYTGRYLQGGCGGACGLIYEKVWPDCANKLAFGGDFAISFNNSGHVGPEVMDTLWAAHAPQLREDYAHRAAHVMAQAGKEILARFYGDKPAYSYFIGCSNGGREGMMEAQRYPEDFDGILAGAPALWVSAGVVRILHEARIARDENDELILTPEAVELLHRAVMDSCDGLDGVKDGQIDSPRACNFDPQVLVCAEGKSKGCISARQAEVIRALYRGPVDESGKALFFGGQPYGSEQLWLQPGSFLIGGANLAANQVKYMIYNGETNQDFDWKTWKPDRQALVDIMKNGGYYNANNPDLSAFKAAGGKLIMWQGEADGAGGSHILLDYYQRVRNTMGGFAATDPFLKVYMLPGVYHCSGGYVAYQHDLLGHLINWVERGNAPDAITGAAILADGAVRKRPVWPYPVKAKYNGSGDVNDPASFSPERPESEPADAFDWLGADLFKRGASQAR